MEEDKLKHDAKRFASGLPSQAYDETKTGKQEISIPQPSVKQPKESQIFDMFAEDEDEDMDVPITQPVAAAMNQPPGQELDVSMMDNWDDPQGYYNVMLGEIF
ncbi:U4/U6 small nuclear ribonucleoprotein prp4, partial [Ascosphaera atra]